MFFSILFGVVFVAVVLYLIFRKQKKREVNPRRDDYI